MKPTRPTARSAIPPVSWPWLERPAVDMGLRIGTAALMAAAGALVLIHLIGWSGGFTTAEEILVQQSSACFLSGCP